MIKTVSAESIGMRLTVEGNGYRVEVTDGDKLKACMNDIPAGSVVEITGDPGIKIRMVIHTYKIRGFSSS